MLTKLSVTEYARLNDISRTAAQKRIDTETLPAEKVGKYWVITLDLTEAERKKAFIKKIFKTKSK